MGILGTISGVLKYACAVNDIASHGPAHGYTKGTEYPGLCRARVLRAIIMGILGTISGVLILALGLGLGLCWPGLGLGWGWAEAGLSPAQPSLASDSHQNPHTAKSMMQSLALCKASVSDLGTIIKASWA